VRQFAHTDATWFAGQPWPRLQAWLAGFEAGPRFQAVMEKHAPWQASDVRIQC
jgi:glutathione S-transferase